MDEHSGGSPRPGWWPYGEGDHGAAPPLLELLRDRVERVALLAMQSSPAPLPGDEPAAGTSVYVASVATALARIGVACDIYTRASRPEQPPLRELGPGVRLLYVPAGPAEPLAAPRLPRLAEDFARGVAEVGAELGPYQLLSAHRWLSGLAGLWLRERWEVPMEFRPHSLALERNHALPGGHLFHLPERAQAEARLVASADLLVGGSASECEELLRCYGVVADRVRLVPCGVDAELFRPGDRRRARDSLGLDLQGRHLLLYAGRLDPIKGVDLAVDAFMALSGGWPGLDVELLVVGGSSQPERYRRQLAALRNRVAWQGAAGRVHFLPARPHQAMAAVYRVADLLLMPSLSETFGLVALEAQACGLPVVASRAGSLPEVVSHGISGMLVAQRDPSIWARALAALLSRPAWLQAMRAAAAAQAARFSWHATATSLLAAYHETLACFSRPTLTGRGPDRAAAWSRSRSSRTSSRCR